jgi:hypothetical protein
MARYLVNRIEQLDATGPGFDAGLCFAFCLLNAPGNLAHPIIPIALNAMIVP